MAVRLLRDGIVDSEAVNSLSWAAEVFYRRLMSVVDDFGRFDGRLSVLRCRLYPVGVERVREADLERWIAECEKARLVALYAVNGKPYILFHKLGEPRAKKSKYPAPPANLQTTARMCSQTNADVPYSSSTSDSISDSSSRPTSGAAPPSVGRSPPVESFDPLRESERQRKEFISAWNAAGLKPIRLFSGTLQGRLVALMLIPDWAAAWRSAVERAGQIPFLAQGLNRQQGRLDVSQFLQDDDFARKILEGVYDPRPPVSASNGKHPQPVPKVKTLHEFAAEVEAQEKKAQ